MDMPFNWFSMFEEARQWQKQWHLDYWPSEVMDNIPPPPLEETNTSDHETPSTHQLDADDIHQDRPEEQNKPTPAMELQKQYRAALEVTQQKLEQSTIEPKQIEAEQNPIASKPPELKLRVSKSLEPRTVPQAPMEQNTLAEEEPKLKPKRSFSSFFLKKKKSKKPLRQEESKNRKSAPPTPSVIPKQYQKSLSDNTVPSTEEASVTQTPSFKPSTLGAKMELFDIDSFMDMQATFAFLNETSNIDSSFSFMNSAITHKTS
ncbi:uncharacterized protein B0P05DRAFT_553326 [Gilbertella persicaria]|uniref:uncharacterized protein n=1 Tax=Gilbertella persicaria TaxID=101096 RepID=UPI002220ACC9|nr:uncharacterized protein B0P05DRAFT_553326 [Gilbertella persicaria]KAI8066195.1 hypothetical protein B0P05DRAFT_553326 [Gilbertella persicaria]